MARSSNTTLHGLDGPVVVKAWGPWCGSCRALAPIVDDVADSTGVPVLALRVDTDIEQVEGLGVRAVPTLVAVRDGVEVGRLVGLQPPDAVRSLFAVAAGTGQRVRPKAPRSLIALRVVSGAILGVTAAVLGSLALAVVGILAIVWGVFDLARR